MAHRGSDARWIKEIHLETSVENLERYEEITIKINGETVSAADIKRTNAQQFDAIVQPSLLRRGINEIVIAPGPRSIGRFSSVVTGFKLIVDYNHKIAES